MLGVFNVEVKVVKFGGSSLANANQFKKVADIIKAEKSRKYVVASAPGKRFSGDEKVTDLLYKCHELVINNMDFTSVFEEISNRYHDIVNDLQINTELDKELYAIKEIIKTNPGSDFIASRGEYLNSFILAEYLGFDFIDASTSTEDQSEYPLLVTTLPNRCISSFSYSIAALSQFSLSRYITTPH